MTPDNQQSLPTKREIADGYDQIADKIVMPRKFYRRCISLLRPRMFGGAQVADLGCGQGGLLDELQSLPLDLKLSGCDLSPILVEKARKLVPGAAVQTGDLEALPFADGSFDFVFATEVLEHLATPLIALKEMHRVLRRGGWLLISLPNRDWVRFDRYVEERRKFQPVDDHFYRVSELEGLLKEAGFSVEKVRGAESYYVGGGLPRLVEKTLLAVFPGLQRRMKRMILISTRA